MFEQKNLDYLNADKVGLMRDVRLATGALSHSDITRNTHNARAMRLISKNPTAGFQVRNALFSSKDSVVGDKRPYTDTLTGIDKSNIEYQRLIAMRELLIQNPNATLQALDASIESTFVRLGLQKSEIITIESLVADINPEKFDTIWNINISSSHIWKVFFLEACIQSGKCIEKVLERARGAKKIHEVNKYSFEYWDYHNIIRLAETKSHLTQVIKSGKAFTISGGAGNTLSSLGVISQHIENGGTISSISGTSMGGAIAVLIGSIGNNIVKIKELMSDIENGFEFEGKRYDITSLNLYIPGVPLLAKRFIEQLLIKYGVGKSTTFSELKIPVIINAGRQYKNGEQEIVLGGGDNVHNSTFASMNVPVPGLRNFGGIGNTPIDEVKMIDYAANERGNPTHWLEGIGIQEKDMIVIDAGYSSESWTEDYGTKTRLTFTRATQRDFFAKEKIRQKGGIIININPGLAGEGGGGRIYPERTKKLYELGIESNKNLTSPPSPQTSPQ